MAWLEGIAVGRQHQRIKYLLQASKLHKCTAWLKTYSSRHCLQKLYACSGHEPGTEEEELARQYAEAVAQDQIALASIRDRATKEQTKGLAVLHQKQLWEHNLELRILLQRCLQAANRMPHAASHAAVLSADQGLAQGYASLVATASDVIDEMLALHSALIEQHPAAHQSAEANVIANGKRQRQEAEHGGEGVNSAKKWQRIDEEYRKLVPFRDASVDR